MEKMHTFSNGERHRGGKRDGAGRKPRGKSRYTVTLTATNVETAKSIESNLSGLLDELLHNWLKSNAIPKSYCKEAV
jgi:hypothetical protein